MSSVTSVSSGVSDLLRTFSGSGPASLPSALSSPGVQTALQNAPAADLVQLSEQALQLQQVAGLFGSSDAAQATTDPLSLLLQALANPSQANEATTGAASTPTPASYAAAAEASAEQTVSALFGTNSGTGTGNSISLLG